MALQPSYPSRDAIPEGLAEHYAEQSDGSYKLDLEGGVKTQADVDKVMKALEDEREAHKETKRKLKAIPDDFDPDLWDQKKNLEPSNGREDVEEVKSTYSQKLKDQKQEYESKLEEKEKRFKKTIKERRLQDALLSKGVNDPIRLDDAVTRVMRHEDVEAIETDEGTYEVVVGSLRETPEEFAESWVTTDEGKRYVSAGNNTGGGAGGDGSPEGEGEPNPWKDETWNMTAQNRIYREDKDKAQRLARAAGKELKVAS